MKAGIDSPWLSPEELERFKNFLLFAKTLVEGYYIGRHRSPREGKAVEFSDYRPYVEGEDASHVDWRVFARTRQLICRRHHEETDMSVHLFMDSSKSMGFSGENRATKHEICARICAALAYLIIRQGDKVSWTKFSKSVLEHLPPAGTRRHLFELLNQLERTRLKKHTDLAQSLDDARGLIKKRGRLVILSDFWCDHEALFKSLDWYIHRRFEVLLLKIEDPWERNLATGQRVRFIDMENGGSVEVDPAEIRSAYQQAYLKHSDSWQDLSKGRGIDTSIVSTSNPYLAAIEAYFGHKVRD